MEVRLADEEKQFQARGVGAVLKGNVGVGVSVLPVCSVASLDPYWASTRLGESAVAFSKISRKLHSVVAYHFLGTHYPPTCCFPMLPVLFSDDYCFRVFEKLEPTC